MIWFVCKRNTILNEKKKHARLPHNLTSIRIRKTHIYTHTCAAQVEPSRWHAWTRWRNHGAAMANTSEQSSSANVARPTTWRAWPVCPCRRPVRPRRPMVAPAVSVCPAACPSWRVPRPSTGTRRKSRTREAAREVASRRSTRRSETRHRWAAWTPPRACPSSTRPDGSRAWPRRNAFASRSASSWTVRRPRRLRLLPRPQQVRDLNAGFRRSSETEGCRVFCWCFLKSK